MPIIHTNQFWDYIINEPLSVVNRAKQLLTRKDYDYENKKDLYATYWQEFSEIETEDYFIHKVIRFPGGLTRWLANQIGLSIEYKPYLEKEYDEDEILDVCEKMAKINSDFEIRDYQIEAALSSLNNFRSLIYSGVGSGKTSILCIVCNILKNQKILILNNNNFILQQIYDRLKSFHIENISWEKGGEPDYTKQIVILNTAGSDSRLNRQDEKYLNYLKNEVNTICYDECQHVQSITFFEPIFYTNFDNLKHIIGYSGSPFREQKDPYNNFDDFCTIAILGEPAFAYEMKTSIKEKSIAQPYGYFINYKNKDAYMLPQFKDNYYMIYRANITYNKERNKAGIEMLKFLNKYNIKTLASFNNIKPGQARMKELKEQGIKSLFICGNETIYEWINGPRGGLKLDKRKGDTDTIKEAMSKNGYNIIFGSTVLDEGVDIDIFQAVVLWSAGKTPISGIQRIGRASRKKKTGQNVSFVIDFNDTGGNYIFGTQYEKRKKMMLDSGVKLFNNVIDFINFIKEIAKENK